MVQLHVESRDWSEAFRLAEHLPQVLPSVHFQHAQWLAESDEFIKAHESYISAGKPNEAIKLIKSLTECSVSENRFLDASYYMWLRAKQVLRSYVREQGYAKTCYVIYSVILKLSPLVGPSVQFPKTFSPNTNRCTDWPPSTTHTTRFTAI